MIRIFLNDEPVMISLTENSLLCAIETLGFEPEGAGSFAVALNGEFVPLGHYHLVSVSTDDRLEIVAPMQGAS